MFRVFVRCCVALLISGAFSAHAQFRAGPMAGQSGRDFALIWLMTEAPTQVRIEYAPADAPRKGATVQLATEAANGNVAHLRLDGLAPGTRYRYRAHVGGRAGAWQTFVTQPAAGAPPRDVTLATGSCAYLADPGDTDAARRSEKRFRIFDVIADKAPDVMLWLGDTNYYRDEDFSPEPPGVAARMNARWLATRTHPGLTRLLRTGQHLAIWDDHDYGPNDADKSFTHKNLAAELFKHYWANASYGLPATHGIFSKASVEDVDLFLLDDRFHRDDDAAPETPDKAMFGPAQIEWLKRELTASRAAFKLIVAGSRMLSDKPAPDSRGGEGWHNHPVERTAFLQWLQAAGIDGVVFVSGDIHYTHLTERKRESAYPLVELTCSPLTSGVHPRPNPVTPVAGTVLLEQNFCTLDFAGKPGARELRIAAWNADGKRVWQRAYSAAALRSAGH